MSRRRDSFTLEELLGDPNFDAAEWEECHDEDSVILLWWWRFLGSMIAITVVGAIYYFLEQQKEKEKEEPGTAKAAREANGGGARSESFRESAVEANDANNHLSAEPGIYETSVRRIEEMSTGTKAGAATPLATSNEPRADEDSALAPSADTDPLDREFERVASEIRDQAEAALREIESSEEEEEELSKSLSPIGDGSKSDETFIQLKSRGFEFAEEASASSADNASRDYVPPRSPTPVITIDEAPPGDQAAFADTEHAEDRQGTAANDDVQIYKEAVVGGVQRFKSEEQAVEDASPEGVQVLTETAAHVQSATSDGVQIFKETTEESTQGFKVDTTTIDTAEGPSEVVRSVTDLREAKTTTIIQAESSDGDGNIAIPIRIEASVEEERPEPVPTIVAKEETQVTAAAAESVEAMNRRNAELSEAAAIQEQQAHGQEQEGLPSGQSQTGENRQEIVTVSTVTSEQAVPSIDKQLVNDQDSAVLSSEQHEALSPPSEDAEFPLKRIPSITIDEPKSEHQENNLAEAEGVKSHKVDTQHGKASEEDELRDIAVTNAAKSSQSAEAPDITAKVSETNAVSVGSHEEATSPPKGDTKSPPPSEKEVSPEAGEKKEPTPPKTKKKVVKKSKSKEAEEAAKDQSHTSPSDAATKSPSSPAAETAQGTPDDGALLKKAAEVAEAADGARVQSPAEAEITTGESVMTQVTTSGVSAVASTEINEGTANDSALERKESSPGKDKSKSPEGKESTPSKTKKKVVKKKSKDAETGQESESTPVGNVTETAPAEGSGEVHLAKMSSTSLKEEAKLVEEANQSSEQAASKSEDKKDASPPKAKSKSPEVKEQSPTKTKKAVVKKTKSKEAEAGQDSGQSKQLTAADNATNVSASGGDMLANMSSSAKDHIQASGTTETEQANEASPMKAKSKSPEAKEQSPPMKTAKKTKSDEAEKEEELAQSADSKQAAGSDNAAPTDASGEDLLAKMSSSTKEAAKPAGTTETVQAATLGTSDKKESSPANAKSKSPEAKEASPTKAKKKVVKKTKSKEAEEATKDGAESKLTAATTAKDDASSGSSQQVAEMGDAKEKPGPLNVAAPGPVDDRRGSTPLSDSSEARLRFAGTAMPVLSQDLPPSDDEEPSATTAPEIESFVAEEDSSGRKTRKGLKAQKTEEAEEVEELPLDESRRSPAAAISPALREEISSLGRSSRDGSAPKMSHNVAEASGVPIHKASPMAMDDDDESSSERKLSSVLSVVGVTSMQEALQRIQTLHEVQDIMRRAGLETSNLIFGIDYTASNKYQGEKCFGGRSLHSINPDVYNPYQQVIRIMGKTLAPFATSGQIPAFGFGDVHTSDWSVFCLKTALRDQSLTHETAALLATDSCTSFDEVLQVYNAVTPKTILSGPTNFAPLILQAIDICKQHRDYHILVIVADGQVTNERATRRAIVEACKYPLSIIVVGVGDGPWDMMRVFDDSLPKRPWDNFHFLEFQKIMVEVETSETPLDLTFAIHALLEIPDQYKKIKALGLIS